jgi:hypothetical protein
VAGCGSQPSLGPGRPAKPGAKAGGWSPTVRPQARMLSLLAVVAGALTGGPPPGDDAAAVASAPLPPFWPAAFDAVWVLCCEHWITSWHGANWSDTQIVSYDYASRRQTTLHTDMYGMGPGRDWILPNGTVVFQSDNTTDRFRAPCCVKFTNLGVVTPDWARRDSPVYMGTEVINVSSVFPGPPRRTAHKWSNPGAGGPLDTNYYWQLGGLSSNMSASMTAQYGASEFLPPPDGNPNISAGYFRITRPITARPQNLTLLSAPAECVHAAENGLRCPDPKGSVSNADRRHRYQRQRRRQQLLLQQAAGAHHSFV